MSWSRIKDLLAGKPRVALSPSHVLHAEVTTPYGQEPTTEAVDAVWRSLVGDRVLPAWLEIGRRETPAGLVWRLLYCPACGSLPAEGEVVVPQVAWIHSLLAKLPGPRGIHVRLCQAPDGFWAGRWEGELPLRLHGPHATREAALERIAVGAPPVVEPSEEVPELVAPWRAPSQDDLRQLLSAQPSMDLLPEGESLSRQERREGRSVGARVLLMIIAFGVVSAGLGIFQWTQARARAAQEARLESVRSLVETESRLDSLRLRLVDTLRGRGEVLAPNSSADKVLRAMARHLPKSGRVQVFALEQSARGFRCRMELRISQWGDVQPFTDALRALTGSHRVAVVSQNRQADGVLAVVEWEGDWP